MLPDDPPARDLFPHTRNLAYLDHAATAPLSTPVVDAVQAFIRERHLTEPNNYLALEPVLRRCRERLATLIGAPVERVEFAPNTSYAINVLAQGLDWRPGDRVAVPACEFPANVAPWLGLAHRGVGVDFIPHDEATLTPDDIGGALTPRTRVLAISWVQFLSGFRCDLGELGERCRARGVLLAVDAIQGIGALRLDVAQTPVDFIACGGHKWLLGMPATAFLYVSEELQERLTPMRGWASSPIDFNDLLAYSTETYPDARRFRVGTLDLAGVVALDAALGLYLAQDRAAAEARVLELARLAGEGFDDLGLTRFGSHDLRNASGIVSARHPRPEAVLAALDDAGVRASVRNGLLRLSPTWYNTAAEVRRAIDVIAEHN